MAGFDMGIDSVVKFTPVISESEKTIIILMAQGMTQVDISRALKA